MLRVAVGFRLCLWLTCVMREAPGLVGDCGLDSPPLRTGRWRSRPFRLFYHYNAHFVRAAGGGRGRTVGARDAPAARSVGKGKGAAAAAIALCNRVDSTGKTLTRQDQGTRLTGVPQCLLFPKQRAHGFDNRQMSGDPAFS